MKLAEYGWSNFWNQHLDKIENIARVIRVEKDRFYLIGNQGELEGKLSGNFRLKLEEDSNSLCVGDWVLCGDQYTSSSGGVGVQIQDNLERKSFIARPSVGGGNRKQLLAANIDFAFLVASANDDLSVNRLRRYVLLCKEGEVVPVIVLSKIDLIRESADLQSQLQASFPQLHIIGLSNVDGSGVEEIRKYLSPGVTGVFLGSSGVGKSTLSNLLLEKEIQAVQGIREDDSKGRHTTTQRSLFVIPSGGLIVDTPGLREVGVLGSSEHTADQFREIDELTKSCRFSNCQHNEEPGCAVSAALEEGSIEEQDWSEYNKLLREQEFANSKINKAKKSNSKTKWKKIHKKMRVRKKFEKKNGMKGW